MRRFLTCSKKEKGLFLIEDCLGFVALIMMTMESNLRGGFWWFFS